ncbi:hypothetical protein DFH06DRAFT_1407976 [Mycena polygramma]|nr:hypothetical protein DFH06DRAFT_1407976 [Mycena polygramma]
MYSVPTTIAMRRGLPPKPPPFHVWRCLVTVPRPGDVRTVNDQVDQPSCRLLALPAVHFSLADFPLDVLLEIAKQLDVASVLTLLTICHALHELRLQQSLWLNALKRIVTVEMQPVPCEDPKALSLSELEDVVRRTNRLMRNFLSDRPRPVSVRTLSIPETDRVFCIPGQNLVVAHSEGSVDCWDILTSDRVASLRIAGLRVRSQAPCMDIQGTALIAASLGTSADNLVAIHINFHDRAHITISYSLSPRLTHTYTIRGDFFITPEVLGVRTHSHAFSWSMKAGDPVQWTAQDIYRPAGAAKPLYIALGGSLYAFHGGSDVADATVQRLALPNSQPPADSNSNVIALNIPHSFTSSQREVRGLLGNLSLYTHPSFLFPPTYGIFAIASRLFLRANNIFPTIQFCPAHADGLSGSISFEPGCFYDHPDQIDQIAVGISGTYVLLLVRHPVHMPPYLGLLHFSGTPVPRTTFRKLDFGTFELSGFGALTRGKPVLYAYGTAPM